MARQSAASLSVVPAQVQRRMDPPGDISEAEAEVWRAVVNSKPPEWMQGDSAPLLKDYCRAVVLCDWITGQINQAIGQGEEPDRWVKMRDMESRRMTTLAVKMRLTQQSRYTPLTSAVADRKSAKVQPWQSAG